MNLTELQTYYPQIFSNIVNDENSPQIRPNSIFNFKEYNLYEYITFSTDEEYFTFLINDDDSLLFVYKGEK